MSENSTHSLTNSSQPILPDEIFDWRLIAENDPSILVKNQDTEKMSEIMSAFVLCKFTQKDCQIIHVPIVVRLLKFLQIIINYLIDQQKDLEMDNKKYKSENRKLKNKMANQRKQISQCQNENEALKKIEKCYTCGATFTSINALDKHINKFHQHVYKSWRCVCDNKPDDSVVAQQELWNEITELRRSLLEQNRSLVPCSYTKNGTVVQSIPAEKVEKQSVKKKQRKSSISEPSSEISVENIKIPQVRKEKKELKKEENSEFNVDEVDYIPQKVQMRAQKFLDRRNRFKYEPESLDKVSKRIENIIKTQGSEVSARHEELRKQYMQSVERQFPKAKKTDILRITPAQQYQRIREDLSFSYSYSEDEKNKAEGSQNEEQPIDQTINENEIPSAAKDISEKVKPAVINPEAKSEDKENKDEKKDDSKNKTKHRHSHKESKPPEIIPKKSSSSSEIKPQEIQDPNSSEIKKPKDKAPDVSDPFASDSSSENKKPTKLKAPIKSVKDINFDSSSDGKKNKGEAKKKSNSDKGESNSSSKGKPKNSQPKDKKPVGNIDFDSDSEPKKPVAKPPKQDKPQDFGNINFDSSSSDNAPKVKPNNFDVMAKKPMLKKTTVVSKLPPMNSPEEKSDDFLDQFDSNADPPPPSHQLDDTIKKEKDTDTKKFDDKKDLPEVKDDQILPPIDSKDLPKHEIPNIQVSTSSSSSVEMPVRRPRLKRFDPSKE